MAQMLYSIRIPSDTAGPQDTHRLKDSPPIHIYKPAGYYKRDSNVLKAWKRAEVARKKNTALRGTTLMGLWPLLHPGQLHVAAQSHALPEVHRTPHDIKSY